MISCLRREAKRADAVDVRPAESGTSASVSGSSGSTLQVEYLPIVSARFGTLTGAEAIVRCGDEPAGLRTPDFATLFDGHCANLARWQCCAPGNVTLSIDIAAEQLLDERFCAVVAHCIRRHAIRPARIRFELREPRDRDVTGILIKRLSDLRRTGAALVLDDFGLAHSTLSSLITLPVSGLKFGRQFTASLPHDPTSADILTSVVNLARNLGISVALDGVDDARQLVWLGRFGDLDVQGDLISTPLSSEALLYWLLRTSTLSAPVRHGGHATRNSTLF